MGLSVVVGHLADMIANDPNEVEFVQSDFTALNAALAQKNLAPVSEPEDCAVWSADMLGYSGLHALREVAGLIWAGRDIPKEILLDGSQTEHADALTKEFYEHLSGKGQFTLVGRAFRQIFKAKEKPKLPPFVHLLIHSDCDGFYVPVAFETPIVPKPLRQDEEHLWPIGSVMRLEAEINQLAQHLDIPAQMQWDDEALSICLDAPNRAPNAPLWQAQPIAAQSCVILRQACAQSLATGASIYFC